MKTSAKLEKMGYSISYNLGYIDGEQCIKSVSAKHPKHSGSFNAKNITRLYNAIKSTNLSR